MHTLSNFKIIVMSSVGSLDSCNFKITNNLKTGLFIDSGWLYVFFPSVWVWCVSLILSPWSLDQAFHNLRCPRSTCCLNNNPNFEHEYFLCTANFQCPRRGFVNERAAVLWVIYLWSGSQEDQILLGSRTLERDAACQRSDERWWVQRVSSSLERDSVQLLSASETAWTDCGVSSSTIGRFRKDNVNCQRKGLYQKG